MTDSALRTKVSTHSRDSAQFPYISGIPWGAATASYTSVADVQHSPQTHQRRWRDELGGRAHDHKYIPCGQAKPWSRRRHFCRPPAHGENQGAGLGAQPCGRERPANEGGVRRFAVTWGTRSPWGS